MKDIIIIHGTKGSPDINWFQWVKAECEKSGHRVYVPQFPTPDSQNPKEWLKTLKNLAPAITPDTILIGHSIGATFLLHVLEHLKQPVYKTIFVSVVMAEMGSPEYDPLIKPFLKIDDFDWLTISNNMGDCYLLHGDNDPYVNQDHSAFLQDQIGGDFIVIPNGGHLNSESGYTKFELLLDLIKAPPQIMEGFE